MNMKLANLLLVTSDEIFGKIYYKQDEIYEGFLQDAFDLLGEDDVWVLNQEVFHIELISDELHIYTR